MLILKISKYRNFRTSLGDLFQCLTSCLTGNSLATASDKQQHLELEWHSELPGLLNVSKDQWYYCTAMLAFGSPN